MQTQSNTNQREGLAVVSRNSQTIPGRQIIPGKRICRPWLGNSPMQRQGGAALIIALVILVILTSMGVAGLKTANLEEQFTGNVRDRSRAFSAAEAALRSAESWLAGLGSKPASCSSSPCGTGVFSTFALADGFFALKDFSWWASNGQAYTAPGASELLGDEDGDGISTLSAQPRYIIEEVRYVPDDPTLGFGVSPGRTFYRVSALGQGGSQYTNVVLQSTYAKRF